MKNFRSFCLVVMLLAIAVGACTLFVDRKPEKRYFFVGYDASSKTQKNVGNFYYTAYSIIPNDSLRKEVYERFKCEAGITFDRCIITSVYEFNDSIEYLLFKGTTDEAFPDCTTK